MRYRRVVVTGLGMVSPLGLDVASSWQGIIHGKSGIGPITHFDASEFTSRIAGEVKNFDITPYLSAKEARKFELFIHYALAASFQAWDDAGIDINSINSERCGAYIGSGIGGLPGIEKAHQTFEQRGPRRISPFFVPGSIINMAAGALSIYKGLQGPNLASVTACTTGTHCIGEAARIISYGDADVMVAGGSEMATSPVGVGGFAAARALSTRNDQPTQASRPFDRDRDGFVLSEGAGAVVLEEYEHAKQRGASMYAELAGYGTSADAYHMTSPSEGGEGAARCMRNALSDAQLNADLVQYINAHGTSTPLGDIAECSAVKSTFGDHARHLAMSSTKSMIGHGLGAAGSLEAIFTILALRDGVLPPTINVENQDPQCDLDVVPNEARQQSVQVAMSNSFGFGGTNGCLLFRTV
ncbi:MAG TPA: beta-ketoacyl-[acyl-carrier-protein] synthase II [Gammaproteobacteria bacterium]|nr:beta-ketoacyl-[acyl-carrier-protein] synthase II [Gammaproteobacteria bacterium]